MAILDDRLHHAGYGVIAAVHARIIHTVADRRAMRRRSGTAMHADIRLKRHIVGRPWLRLRNRLWLGELRKQACGTSARAEGKNF